MTDRDRTCVACDWRGDVGHEAHIKFIHPDESGLIVVEQMGRKFIVRAASEPPPADPLRAAADSFVKTWDRIALLAVRENWPAVPQDFGSLADEVARLRAALASPAAPEGLDAAARFARDLIANYLWNEDDSGDENQLEAAYERLVAVLGHATEEEVGATLARAYAEATR